MCLSVWFSVCMSLFVSVLFLGVCVSLCLCLSLSLCVSLCVCVSLSVDVSVCVSPSQCGCFYVSLCCLYVFVSLSV